MDIEKRLVLEVVNPNTGNRTTYYVEPFGVGVGLMDLVLAVFFSRLHLVGSIIFLLMGTFMIWLAIDVEESDGETSEG